MDTFSDDLSRSLPEFDSKLKWYINSLKTNNEFHKLNIFHFCMKDCDDDGNLKINKTKSASDYVFVKFFGYEDTDGSKKYLLSCDCCNSDSEILKQIHSAGRPFEKKFVEQREKDYCIHCRAVQLLKPAELDEYDGPWVMYDNVPDIQELNRGPNKPWTCAVWSGGSYGLLYKNRANAKTIRCIVDKDSKACQHIYIFNKWESEEDDCTNTTDDPSENIEKSDQAKSDEKVEFPKTESFFGEKSSQKFSPHPGLIWPLPDDQYQQFLNLAEEGFQYKELAALVPDCSGHCPNGFAWNQDCPVKEGYIFSRNVTIHHHTYIKPRNLVAYYRPCTGDCNCINTYTGAQDCLYNTNEGKVGSPVHLVTYASILMFTCEFAHVGSTLYGWLSGINRGLRDIYRQVEFITLRNMQRAVTGLWKVLDFGDLKKVFSCSTCGPRPKAVVIDGVCIGIYIQHLEGENLFIPFSKSKPVLTATNYGNRHFVKPWDGGRKQLKMASQSLQYPKFGRKKITDPGLAQAKQFYEMVKKNYPEELPKEYTSISKLLSSSTSTVSLFQPFDFKLASKLLGVLHRKEDFLVMDNVEFASELRNTYPGFFNIYKDIRLLEKGTVPDHLFELLESILLHTMNVWQESPKRTEDDYEKYEGDEVHGQFYPCFPIRYYRAKYDIDGKENNDFWSQLCTKLWSEHVKFSPGLFLMLCTCSDKKIYGFQKLTMKESPRLMFDFIQCRCELDYNPDVLYDASCLLKEFGLNRETRRFMEILAATDPVHEDNHTGCLSTFMSTLYPHMKCRNRESAEQFNSLLRKVSSSLVFMNLDNYLTAVKVFCAFFNLM